jgi:DNA-binding MarR family transcriptional regulator
MPTPKPELDEEVELVRAFNRLYSQRMGVLGQQIYDSSFSMTEMRVIYEIHQAQSTTARDLALDLDLDSGYLSRILQRFEAQRIITKKPSRTDARKRKISLTPKGWETYMTWANKANKRIRALLDRLDEEQRVRLLAALQSVHDVLSEEKETKKGFKLRPHTAGDMGLIIHTHAV